MRGMSSILSFFRNEFYNKKKTLQQHDVLSYDTKRTLKSRFWRKCQDFGYCHMNNFSGYSVSDYLLLDTPATR